MPTGASFRFCDVTMATFGAFGTLTVGVFVLNGRDLWRNSMPGSRPAIPGVSVWISESSTG